MTKSDIQIEGRNGRLGEIMTAAVVDGPSGKEYRLPTQDDLAAIERLKTVAAQVFEELPFGWPTEPVILDAKGNTWCSLYGIDEFGKLYTTRQLAGLGQLALATRGAAEEMKRMGCDAPWTSGTFGLLTLAVGRLADFASRCVTWTPGGEFLGHTFVRWALPFVWDFCEGNPFGGTSGNYLGAIDWIARATSHTLNAAEAAPEPHVKRTSATRSQAENQFDLILTDPPYYDAIGYSVLMDFFYTWHRRILHEIIDDPSYDASQPLAPKWDKDAVDGELVDDASRFGGNKTGSKQVYENGMYRAFIACRASLSEDGSLVLVFAHKHPDAWETLVSAVIRSGFVVDGSWPIQTERVARTRSQSAAALSSSVWLVCKKRPETARPGWDNHVLEEMKANITAKLREFWDAGIRGPDFVWAATGPALEAYSKHPVVRKANEPNATMTVGEFLNHVRRMVVDYVVGQVLTGEQGSDLAAADRLDEVTAYYLLHRHDFGMDDAPVGACILYATACGLSDTDLEKSWDLLVHAGGGAAADAADVDDGDADSGDGDADDADDGTAGGGGKVKLKAWSQRHGKNMGYEAPAGKAVPLIDRIHRVMHLWHEGDVQKVDEYLDQHALRRNELFKRVVQSLIELSSNSERSLMEKISNHIGAKGATPEDNQMKMRLGEEEP